VPEVVVYVCIEMSPDDFAVVYSIAQKKGKDIRTYLRDVIREDVARTLQQPAQPEAVKRGVEREVKGGE